ncbi:MAG: zinc ribbon domain-containing protein [Candidatus Bathyarchaeota archaeon]|nr:zinc ribbon domain-containing protein [Candidatus Bathyarchaeota archaeon]
MSHRRFASKVVVTLLCIFLLTAIGITVVQAKTQTKTCSFSVSNDWISGSFSSTINMTTGTISPGEKANVSCTLINSNLNLVLNLENITGISSDSFSGSINPISKGNATLTGLSYISSTGENMSVLLNFEAYISGIVASNGTTNKASLTWVNTTSPGLTLTAPSTSKEGDLVSLSLTNITYTLSIGLLAQGATETITLIPANQASYATSSSDVTLDMSVVNPYSTNWLLWVVAIVLIAACSLVSVMFVRAKKELKTIKTQPPKQIPTQQNTPVVPAVAPAPVVKPAPAQPAIIRCKSCGADNRGTAKFCRKCGKQL